ncbi:MAG: hypothetical protein INH43_16130 [Acidobacteriaceae bacterium]|nr:hypothetical protein [Acidobacteriaceae bacterium]
MRPHTAARPKRSSHRKHSRTELPPTKLPRAVVDRIPRQQDPTFDAVLNLTQTTGANNATATFTWDGMRRQRSQALPTGQTVTHTYGLGSAPGASWHKLTTGIAPNLRWTKTVFDGFGRPLEVTTGHQLNGAETPVSKVKTEYTPCACSSIGKVLRVSMPYAANASPLHWTTYTYL